MGIHKVKYNQVMKAVQDSKCILPVQANCSLASQVM